MAGSKKTLFRETIERLRAGEGAIMRAEASARAEKVAAARKQEGMVRWGRRLAKQADLEQARVGVGDDGAPLTEHHSKRPPLSMGSRGGRYYINDAGEKVYVK